MTSEQTYEVSCGKRFDTSLLSGGVVYGPFQARRRGTVVGVNLLPQDAKICNYDCAYCQCGLTNPIDLKQLERCPSLESVTAALKTRFGELAVGRAEIDTIIISGNGEPTLYPQFEQAVKAVIQARDAFLPAAEVAVLTNGTTLDRTPVVTALALVDTRVIKFDPYPPDQPEVVSRPPFPLPVSHLRAGIAKLGDFVLQSMFLQGVADNSTPAAVDRWIENVAALAPLYVEIYTLDRRAPVAGIEKVPQHKLLQIKELLRSRTGIEGRVFE